MLGVEIVARAFPRNPFTAIVVEHDDRDVRRTVGTQRRPLLLDDSFDLILQLQIERGLDPRRPRRGGRGQHHLDEVGREKRRSTAIDRQTLAERLAQLIRRQRAGSGHAKEHRPLAGLGGPQIAERIEGRGTLRQAGEKRRLRRRQHRRLDAEIALAGSSHARSLAAVGGQIQIQRENLALRETMLEPDRERHFLELRAKASRLDAVTLLQQ